MRKMTKILSAIMMVAAVLTACQVESIEELDGRVHKVTFSAGEAEATRTVFANSGSGTSLPVLWTSNEDVRIFPSTFANAIVAPVVPSSDKKTARFVGDMTFSSTARSAFYLLSPASAFGGHVSGTTIKINVPSDQVPTTTSADEKAQVLVAKTPIYRPVPETITLNPTHFTAYIALRLTNITAAGKNPTVEIAANTSIPLAGDVQYDFAEGTFTPVPGSTTNIVKATVPSASGPCIIACLPAEIGNTSLLITVKGLGTTTLRKTVMIPAGKNLRSGVIAAMTVDMNPSVAPTGVTVTPSTLSLEAGKTSQLTATVSPSNATDKTVTWSSSNTNVAMVSTGGLVIAKAVGTATITATTNTGGKTATCAVTVTPGDVPVTGVTLSQNTMKLKVGQTSTLTATVMPADATDKSIRWNSSNPSVATVSSTGVVTGVAPGTATIAATASNGIDARCTVTVDIPVTGVSVSKTSLSLKMGQSEALSAEVIPSDAADKTVTWKSSNTAVATVSSSGVVTGVKPGTATVTVTTNDGGKTATCAVTVQNNPTRIVFNMREHPGDYPKYDTSDDSYHMSTGQADMLYHTVYYADGTTASETGVLSLVSGSGVSISGQYGLLCTAPGQSAVVRIMSKEDSNVYSNLTVRTWDPATSITIGLQDDISTGHNGIIGWMKENTSSRLTVLVNPSTARQKVVITNIENSDGWNVQQNYDVVFTLTAPKVNGSTVAAYKNKGIKIRFTNQTREKSLEQTFYPTNIDVTQPKLLDYVAYSAGDKRYCIVDGGLRIQIKDSDGYSTKELEAVSTSSEVSYGYTVGSPFVPVAVVTGYYPGQIPKNTVTSSSFPDVVYQYHNGRDTKFITLPKGSFHGFAIALKNCENTYWSSSNNSVDNSSNFNSSLGKLLYPNSAQNLNAFDLTVLAAYYNGRESSSNTIWPVDRTWRYPDAGFEYDVSAFPSSVTSYKMRPWVAPTVANFLMIRDSKGGSQGGKALIELNQRITALGGNPLLYENASYNPYWTINYYDSSTAIAFVYSPVNNRYESSAVSKQTVYKFRPFMVF
jgi:uncharacterized protein YjdB